MGPRLRGNDKVRGGNKKPAPCVGGTGLTQLN